MKLTVQAARDLQPGHTLRDHVVPGLMLRARGRPTSPGPKSWHYYYVFEGRERRPKIGEFPTIGIEDAREVAKQLAREIAKGNDPSAERAARRDAPTVGDLIELYDKVHVSKLAPRTQEEYRRNVRLHIAPKLAAERVADVTTAQINDVLDTLPDGARNKVWACLSGMFTLAMHSDYAWRTDRNPAKDARKAVVRPRRRKIEAPEFEAVARALDALELEHPRQVAALRVMLLAGTRVTELVTARREHLSDFKITLGVHKSMRKGEDREIYLPAQARAVIDALPDDGSGYIFGRGIPRVKGRKTDGEPHLTRFHVFAVWEKVREAAGCPDLQVRDLRRSFASVAGSVGVSLDALGQLYGHSDTKTTRGYTWLYEGTALKDAQATADRLSELMTPAAQGDRGDYWSG